MTFKELIDAVLPIVMATATVYVWLLGRDRKTIEDKMKAIEDLFEQRMADLDRRVNDGIQRIDKAGQKASDLADRIQVVAISLARLEGKAKGD